MSQTDKASIFHAASHLIERDGIYIRVDPSSSSFIEEKFADCMRPVPLLLIKQVRGTRIKQVKKEHKTLLLIRCSPPFLDVKNELYSPKRKIGLSTFHYIKTREYNI
ncbi:hypothetical protein YC2023_017097 [Brassica napus]